jgi:hypothetical protein
MFFVLARVGDVVLELPHVAARVGVDQQLPVRQVVLVFEDTLHAGPLVHRPQNVVQKLEDHFGRLVLENGIDNPEVRLRFAGISLQEIVVHFHLIGVLASLVGHKLGVLLQDVADDEEELVNAERERHLTYRLEGCRPPAGAGEIRFSWWARGVKIVHHFSR